MMKCYRRGLLGCLLVVALCCFFIPSGASAFDITIDVSPNVLNIGSASEVVTVHTDIAYNEVAGSSVTLNNVAIYYWKSDDRGYFVAKFVSDEIKELPLVLDDYNTLKLEGATREGETFSGSQDIRVINVIPVGGK